MMNDSNIKKYQHHHLYSKVTNFIVKIKVIMVSSASNYYIYSPQKSYMIFSPFLLLLKIWLLLLHSHMYALSETILQELEDSSRYGERL